MSLVGAQRAEAAFLDRDPWPVVWLRRTVTVGVTCLLLATALAAAPFWIPIAWLLDRALPGRCTLRCGLFLTYYLACEVLGILAAVGLWIRAALRGPSGPGGPRHLEGLFALQRLWSGALLRGAIRIFGFRIEAEGAEHTDRPMLLMLRHVSVADTLLASELVSRPHLIHLRYVLKRELLWDPCLDLVGNRLPNYFVRRDSTDSEREIQGIRDLMADLGSHEGVLIYPEGTRFSRVKRERIIRRLRDGGHLGLAARAERLEHTLPPRLGGTLALLDANPGLDVVFVAHSGFESVASFWELWNGALRDAVVRVKFWRVPALEIPRGREDRIEWLYERWQTMDRWLAQHSGPSRPGEPRVDAATG
ncbi:MAG: lysophospholipid acyltransferase family protein [Myxococcota bacterium]